jgi:hypothetical protein
MGNLFTMTLGIQLTVSKGRLPGLEADLARLR